MELRKKYLDLDIDGTGSFNKKSIDESRLNLRKQVFFKKIMDIKEKQIKEKTQNNINKKLLDLNIPDEIKFVEIQSNEKFNEFILNLLRSEKLEFFKYGIYLIIVNIEESNAMSKSVIFDFSICYEIFNRLRKINDQFDLTADCIRCLGLIKVQTNSMDKKQLKAVFDKTNLELLRDCCKKHKLQSNPEYGIQLIYLINSILEDLQLLEISEIILEIKFIDLFLEELDSRKIDENILKFLFLICSTITENHIKFSLTEKQLNIITENCLHFYSIEQEEFRELIFAILSRISETEYECLIEKITKSKIIKYILENPSTNLNIVIYCIRIIGNLSTNPDYICEFIIEDGVIDFLSNCLNIENNRVLKEALWSISNFFASSKKIIKTVIENKTLLKNMKKLFRVKSTLVKEELFYSLGNFFSNSDIILANKLFELNFDDEILNVFTDTKNPNILTLLIEIIYTISKIAFFDDKNSLGFEEMENENKESYIKVQNPLIKSFIFKGLFDILDNVMSNCNNEDIVQRISTLIEYLKCQDYQNN